MRIYRRERRGDETIARLLLSFLRVCARPQLLYLWPIWRNWLSYLRLAGSRYRYFPLKWTYRARAVPVHARNTSRGRGAVLIVNCESIIWDLKLFFKHKIHETMRNQSDFCFEDFWNLLNLVFPFLKKYLFRSYIFRISILNEAEFLWKIFLTFGCVPNFNMWAFNVKFDPEEAIKSIKGIEEFFEKVLLPRKI